MLNDVKAVLSEPAVLAEIDRKRAVADHRVEWRPEAIDIEAIRGDGLPRKFAPGAKTSNISYERKLSARGNLMPDPRSHDGVDPFKIAGSRDRYTA